MRTKSRAGAHGQLSCSLPNPFEGYRRQPFSQDHASYGLNVAEVKESHVDQIKVDRCGVEDEGTLYNLYEYPHGIRLACTKSGN